MPKVFRETLGIDVDFIRIHRNGVRAQHNGKPVSITAKLSDRSKKDEILNAQKTKKIEKQKLPFFISPQQPPSIVATKNKTYDKFNSLRRQNISARLHRDHILLGTVLPIKRRFQSSQILTHSRSHRSRRKTWTLLKLNLLIQL